MDRQKRATVKTESRKPKRGDSRMVGGIKETAGYRENFYDEFERFLAKKVSAACNKFFVKRRIAKISWRKSK